MKKRSLQQFPRTPAAKDSPSLSQLLNYGIRVDRVAWSIVFLWLQKKIECLCRMESHMPDEQKMVLYSDFNCPYCYAMHERLYGMEVMDRIEWRGVQHAAHLSVPMASWRGRLGAELRDEVDTVRHLAPNLPISMPEGKPNTGLAIAIAARALQLDPLRAARLVRALYHVFWQRGSDVSDPAVLEKVAMSVGLPGPPLLGATAADVSTLTVQWERDWRESGHTAVPLLVRGDGEQVVGLAGAEHLKRFLI